MTTNYSELRNGFKDSLSPELKDQWRYARLDLEWGPLAARETALGEGSAYRGFSAVTRELGAAWRSAAQNADHWYDIQSGQWSDRAPEPWFDDFGETDADGVVLVHEPDWEDYRQVEAAEISREIFGDLSRYL